MELQRLGQFGPNIPFSINSASTKGVKVNCNYAWSTLHRVLTSNTSFNSVILVLLHINTHASWKYHKTKATEAMTMQLLLEKSQQKDVF